MIKDLLSDVAERLHFVFVAYRLLPQWIALWRWEKTMLPLGGQEPTQDDSWREYEDRGWFVTGHEKPQGKTWWDLSQHRKYYVGPFGQKVPRESLPELKIE